MTSWIGQAEAAAGLFHEAAAAAARAGDTDLEATCHANLPVVWATGPTPVAEAIERTELLAAELPDEPRWRVPVLSSLAVLHAQAERIDLARTLAHEAVALARRAGLALHLFHAIRFLADVEKTAGSEAEAVLHLRSAYALRATEHDHVFLPDVAAELAVALAPAGDPAESEALVREAQSRIGPYATAAEVNWRRAGALLAARAGGVDDAVRLAEEARALTAPTDLLGFHAATLVTLASVQRRAGDLAGSDATLAQALTVYERKGNAAGVAALRRRERP
jgi:ATP/maltotriose-dependent transcriptional regulator MalT